MVYDRELLQVSITKVNSIKNYFEIPDENNNIQIVNSTLLFNFITYKY